VLAEGAKLVSHGICFGCLIEAAEHCGLDWREMVEELETCEIGGEG
jgi:hypothetical protein